MYRKTILSLAVLLLASGMTAAQAGPPPGAPSEGISPIPEMVPGEVIVALRSSAPEQKAAVAGRLGLSLARTGLSRLSLVDVGSKQVQETIERLESQPEVLYAEPNYLYRTSEVTPNDPGYPDQWALSSSDYGIGAPTAWMRTTGSSSVTVAVVDSGVDMAHPDLLSNIWRNPGEVAANGVDDDGNGYVDDVNGWDWVAGDNDPSDANGHGTHVAGIAGARGNDLVGVAGTSWRSQIMPLRVLDANGVGSSLTIAQAFRYAARNGAKIVNASFGGDGYSRSIDDAIKASPETLFVVAAGNGGSDGIGDNNETTASYPCNLSSANVVCVAATDRNGTLASFSNYGAEKVDIAAPGSGILSTLPGARWAYASGTSMATPFVAGAAALLWSESPAASRAAVVKSLMEGADLDPSLTDKVLADGRMNVAAALDILAPVAPSAEPEPTTEPEPTATPTPTPTPTEEDPLPVITESPLPKITESPLPEISESPSPEPTESPSPEPTESPEPVLPEPEPSDPEEPAPVEVTSKLIVKKFDRRVVGRGWVEPAGVGEALISLKRRSNGRWRTVVTKAVSLQAVSDSRSVFKAKFKRRSAGRCRLVAVISVHDQTFRMRKTFRC